MQNKMPRSSKVILNRALKKQSRLSVEEEKYLLQTFPNDIYTLQYAIRIIKDRWLELEDIMLTNKFYSNNAEDIFKYITNCVKGPWLEADIVIKKDFYGHLKKYDFLKKYHEFLKDKGYEEFTI
jgi:hypothetical protein